MDDDLQLDLFSQDRIRVREGFSALARLDLTGAAATFSEVLSRWPGHPDASAGLRMAAAWAVSLEEVETLQRQDAAAALWERIKVYAFGQRGEASRRGLIRKAIALLEDDCYSYLPPDVCLGCFLLAVDDHGGAEAALRRLLERRPFDGRLWVYRALGRAERGRAKCAHEEMVEQRRLLKQLSPAVFREYMGRL